jgi:gag-polypeptide of LTR copia-type
MQDHINKVMTLAEQLEAIGTAVSDDGIARTFLCSLPESCKNPVIALESHADDLSAELIRNRLLQKEARRR